MPTSENPSAVTGLLKEWRRGDPGAADRLLPLVYQELRAIAASHLNRERPGHTLQATALVHEAYLRMAGSPDWGWENRAQFFGFAARLLRNILVDHARARNRAKRGSGQVLVCLEDVMAAPGKNGFELVALDDALTELAKRDERQSRMIELRFFSGLSIEETALVMDVSVSTVKSDWRLARAWLFRELGGEATG